LAIASNIGGSAEVISRKELGWIVPAEDVGALVAAMNDAAGLSVTDREARRKAGRDHVAEHFDARKQYAKIIQVIEGSAAPAGRVMTSVESASNAC
jgi:glycosyltransferase involved in cell wall biosynthesis